MTITIRSLETWEEYHACEAVQRLAWAMPNDQEVVPMHLLVAAERNGGVLLGAFGGDRLIGFVFGFPGRTKDGGPKHYSHLLGVLPDVQSEGVGYRLKLAQRDVVLSQGLDLITWTYDPLQSRNAYLNIHKLGAVCRTYKQDYYGPLADGINAGLPSDRFDVEWWIASEDVRRCLDGKARPPMPGPAIQANATRHTRQGLLEPGNLTLNAAASVVQVEIPADYQAVKDADPTLASEWRLGIRQVFEFYFAAGYVVVDFVTRSSAAERRSLYLLRPDRA
jgi:chorismate synthase